MWWTFQMLKRPWFWFLTPRIGFGSEDSGDNSSVHEPAYTRNDDDDWIPQKKRRHGRDERFWDTRFFFFFFFFFLSIYFLQLYGQPLTPMAWSGLSKLAHFSIC
ncbi:hypothetical protein GE21DRAFT_1029475 [Neurospora crassa]|nr:hypothetical protein GE21DRAFT_1029475 [Neurospora crassa]